MIIYTYIKYQTTNDLITSERSCNRFVITNLTLFFIFKEDSTLTDENCCKSGNTCEISNKQTWLDSVIKLVSCIVVFMFV